MTTFAVMKKKILLYVRQFDDLAEKKEQTDVWAFYADTRYWKHCQSI